MKTLFIAAHLLMFSFGTYAQDDAGTKQGGEIAKNYFYLSPFNLIASHLQVGYERDLGKKNSMVLLPGVIVGDNYYYHSDNESIDVGLSAELQYRYHILSATNPRAKAKNAFRFDFYTAPFAAYQYLDFNVKITYYDGTNGNYSYVHDTYQIHGVSGGILFGARFTFFERLSIDVYTGGGMKYSTQNIDYYYGLLRPGYTGIIGKANLQIGLAF